MMNFTETAKTKINEILKDQDSASKGLRVKITDDNQMDIGICELDKLAPKEDPLRDPRTGFFVEYEGFLFIVDPEGQKELADVFVNYQDGGVLSGSFEFKKPVVSPATTHGKDNPLLPKVQDLLDTEINPGLAMHGGRADLVNVVDDKVYLKFGGGCQGCSMIDVTVKQGIETRIKEAFPEISGIVDETDHAAGTNPFFN